MIPIRLTRRVRKYVGPLACAAMLAVGLCAPALAQEQAEASKLTDLEKAIEAKPRTQPNSPKSVSPKPRVENPVKNPATTPVESAGISPRKEQPGLTDVPAKEKEDLRALLTPQENRVVPVTEPLGGSPARIQRARGLPEDGAAVVSRVGSVAPEEKPALGRIWQRVTFEPALKKATLIPRRLLPCQLLEAMEEEQKKKPNVRFRLSGETTVFGRNAYFLPRRVLVIETPAPQPTPSEGKKSTPPAEKKAATPAAKKPTPSEGKKTTTPAEKKPSAADSRTVGTDELIGGLLDDVPGRAKTIETPPARTADENKSDYAPITAPPEPGKGTAVINRLIRLSPRKGGGYEARFVGDNTLRDPPMEILPNIQLTRAIWYSTRIGKARSKLQVSGEVTYYRGKRYLLIRKLIPHRDMGQF